MADEERKDIDYPERDVKDLIEEDKRPFAVRRVITTLLGGFRCVYDEEESVWINKCLYPAQIILYLLIPGIIVLTVFGNPTNLKTAVIISACASFSVVALL